MTSESSQDRILLNRLAYFFKHFKPEQKKFMADSVEDFLTEPKQSAPRSKSLTKILDFMTQKVFKSLGKFGRIISVSKQSPQTLKKRREKMKPSFMLLHRSSPRVQSRILKPLSDTPARRRNKKRVSQSGNVR